MEQAPNEIEKRDLVSVSELANSKPDIYPCIFLTEDREGGSVVITWRSLLVREDDFRFINEDYKHPSVKSDVKRNSIIAEINDKQKEIVLKGKRYFRFKANTGSSNLNAIVQFPIVTLGKAPVFEETIITKIANLFPGSTSTREIETSIKQIGI